MRRYKAKAVLLLLAGALTLGLMALAWAIGPGSSEAQQGTMHNCPQAGKWAISVWSGDDATETGQALATCGPGAVDFAYYIDPDTQSWLRYFVGRTEINTLLTLDEPQGVIAHGAMGAPAPTLTPTPQPTPSPTPSHIITGTGVVADDDSFNFGTGDIHYSMVSDGFRGYLYGNLYSTPTVYFGDAIPASPCSVNHPGYQGVQHITDFGSAEDHTFTAPDVIIVGDKGSLCYQGVLLFHQGMYYGGIDILDIDAEGKLHYQFWYDPSGGTNF